MTTTQINTALYRVIKSGVAYNKYFPNSKCTNTKLATGNTQVALGKMKFWSKKYVDHGKLIAPILKGNTLQETLNNIHRFLYSHIQYSIDGRDQNLKSPACTWATRTQGTDCKSYSIFASVILLNLGVKHYLRRIIQQNVMQDAYTHVYVVIPKNQDTGSLKQGHFIIDATVNNNNEIPFLKKDDVYMELSLPIYGLAAAAINCNCPDSTLLSKEFSSGYFYSDFDNYFGLGTHAENTNDEQDDGQSGLTDVIGSITSSGFFSSTFGAIFANSLDFSCWNSASNPNDQQKIIKIVAGVIQQKAASINNNNAQAVINELSRHITYEWQSYQHSLDRRDWASCTKKAWRLHIKAFLQLQTIVVDALLDKLRSDNWQITQKQVRVSEQSLEDLYRSQISSGNTTAEKNGDITYSVYTLTAPKNPINIVVDDHGIVIPTAPKQAGFGDIGVWLLGAAIIGGIVYGTDVLKPKKGTKK